MVEREKNGLFYLAENLLSLLQTQSVSSKGTESLYLQVLSTTRDGKMYPFEDFQPTGMPVATSAGKALSLSSATMETIKTIKLV